MLCLKSILLNICLFNSRAKTIRYQITLVCSHYSQQGGDLEEALQQLSTLDTAKQPSSASKDSATENKVNEYYQVQQSLRHERGCSRRWQRPRCWVMGSSIATRGDNAQAIDKIRSVAAVLCQQVFITFESYLILIFWTECQKYISTSSFISHFHVASLSGLWSRSLSRLRSRRCTFLHGTFIVQ